MEKEYKMYFANSLFTEADRDYNIKVVNMIKERFGDVLDLYVPQLNDSINDKSTFADAQMIADADYEELTKSDFLLAIIDSHDVGVGLEIGIMYEQGKQIVGLYTDVRQFGADNPDKLEALKSIGQNQFSYVNLMATGLILNNGYLVNNTDDLLDSIQLMIEKERKEDKELEEWLASIEVELEEENE